MNRLEGTWAHPVVIAENNFVYKALSAWSLNVAVGCNHACRFCYVPSASTNKMGPPLKALGVQDPDVDWGEYVFVREWDETKFNQSLIRAEMRPRDKLKFGSNRAVMLCTTTDPYQAIKDRPTMERMRLIVRRSLGLIHDISTLNVRILTRSPLAREDFDLMKLFGNRLMFGMSIPTLNEKLCKVYEPRAPSPRRRLETLIEASEAGLHTFVAVAPTYPECDADDMRATLEAVKEANPLTIFMEPINIRANNVERINAHAKSLGLVMRTEVFETQKAWSAYAINQIMLFEGVAQSLSMGTRVHAWPDKSLGTVKEIYPFATETARNAWLEKRWKRDSEWPGKD